MAQITLRQLAHPFIQQLGFIAMQPYLLLLFLPLLLIQSSQQSLMAHNEGYLRHPS
ncbi:hypothetical protein ACN4EG_17405 [Alkalinema pantanalense CENA528]|uniref:hypothetical protein n=1 Tax=Alkalinema pantanalense TaxID=1620705 RepID=UPI003D6E717F